jgi:hypothetical protein
VSAGGVARPGFERLLAAICAGQVGAVVSIEASRLARNGRDWHTLLEFCALVGCVIVDEDGVYEPRSVNDRLLLGMKGTMSEMELSLLRQRSVEALKLKAARGDLHTTVAIGFVRSDDDRIERDPDLRIREAIAAVFARFTLAGSVRQTLLWFRREHVELPAAVYEGTRRSVAWKLPTYNTVLHILANPVYAGALRISAHRDRPFRDRDRRFRDRDRPVRHRDRRGLEGVKGLRMTDQRGHRLPAFCRSADGTAHDGHTHDQGRTAAEAAWQAVA